MSEPARFPCAQCGAALRFSPRDQLLVCAHCGHQHPIASSELWADGRAPELDYAAALANRIDEAPVETIQTAKCEECGATTDFDANLHAAECVFCAAPLVLDPSDRRQFKPNAVLPFAITEKEAKAALARWLKGLWFAPSDVTAFARAERPLTGVYLPFWAFDADAASRYRGERGTVTYVNRMGHAMRGGKRVQVMRRVAKVRWTRVSGDVRRAFDDVLVMASRSLPHRFTRRLTGGSAPWDLHDLQPYQAEFLAGFRAEAYSVDLEEGFHAARAIMDLQIRRDVRFDIGGDRQRVHEIKTRLSDVRFTHVLLPVWVAAYRYGDETFRFVVNARTAEVIGERPYSKFKIAVAAGVAALAALAAVLVFTGQR